MNDRIDIDQMQQKIVDEEMFKAVLTADVARFQLCLQKGANFNAQDEKGDTPLIIAVRRYWYESFLDYVLSLKPDIFTQNKQGKTIFEVANDITDADAKKKTMSKILKHLPDKTFGAKPKEAPAEAEGAPAAKEIEAIPPVTFKKSKAGGKPGFSL